MSSSLYTECAHCGKDMKMLWDAWYRGDIPICSEECDIAESGETDDSTNKG